MGGAVSAGRNNDELIDHLVEAEFIKTPIVQRVFRAVDRGDYYASDHKENAYRDIAWRMGNLHLSAPCVYSEVMEALKLRAGLSFLNLGSGSGYLSTMAGLVLGPYGTNHGIELHKDIVDFAYDRLEHFIKNSQAVDEYDFCEPTFVVGNCLMLDSSCQQYDRVYCGASCPEEYEAYIKNLVKIGGILIMPYNEKLLKITRTSVTTWQASNVLSVSFAPLVCPPPSKGPVSHIRLGDICPPTLQHICHYNIRSILRKIIDLEHPNLKAKWRRMERRQRRQVRRIVIPIFDESDFSNQSPNNSELEYDSDSPEYTISSRIPSRMSVLLEDFLRRHAELQTLSEMAEQNQNNNVNTQTNDHMENKEDESENKLNNAGKSNNELVCSASFITFSNRKSSTDQPASGDDNHPQLRSFASQTKVTGSKTKLFKRKYPDTDQSPSTSSGHGSQGRAKVKRRAATVVWKRIIQKDSDSEKEEESPVKESVVNEDNYTNFMVKKIGDLPLPIILLRYLNYKRNNL